MICKRRAAKFQKQVMGDLPQEKLSASAPFVFTALDLFGPFKMRDAAGGRRFFKSWGVVYTCLATKACAILEYAGYDSATFMVTHLKFTSLYGVPSKIYSDHGPNIVSGATRLDWVQVSKAAGMSGSTWTFTPKGCSWKNGQAEQGVQLAQTTLAHVLVKGEILNLHQLDATFMRVAAIINLRPIAIWTNSKREYHSISPSDILLGRAARDRPDPTLLSKLEDDQSIKRSLANQEKRVRAWWTAWQSQAFPELVPCAAWKTSHRHVQPRDIALIKQDSQVLGSSLPIVQSGAIYG
jgi:hypothetical protein